MKWNELVRVTKEKLSGREDERSKHLFLVVERDGKAVGKIKISRGTGDVRDREIGNCARSIGAKEANFRKMVGCTLNGAEFWATVPTE